jgi:hypothetical protein
MVEQQKNSKTNEFNHVNRSISPMVSELLNQLALLNFAGPLIFSI